MKDSECYFGWKQTDSKGIRYLGDFEDWLMKVQGLWPESAHRHYNFVSMTMGNARMELIELLLKLMKGPMAPVDNIIAMDALLYWAEYTGDNELEELVMRYK
jgi:hypothetical protein